MLSHEDERRLAAIERQLMSDDPAFVRRLARRGRRARVRWSRALTAVAVVCALATVLGLAGGSAELYLPSIELTVVAGGLYYRVTHRRR
jgi:hypothetical protein